jgi:hypothetical protein
MLTVESIFLRQLGHFSKIIGECRAVHKSLHFETVDPPANRDGDVQQWSVSTSRSCRGSPQSASIWWPVLPLATRLTPQDLVFSADSTLATSRTQCVPIGRQLGQNVECRRVAALSEEYDRVTVDCEQWHCHVEGASLCARGEAST